MEEKNIKLTLSYDGSRFFGWQRQKDSPTVQGEIEKRLEKITGSYTPVTGCGRTDRGVHAIAYTANFKTESRLSPEELKRAINAGVGTEMLVKNSEETRIDFHSRFDAKKKIYRYLLTSDASPLLRNYAYFVERKPDIEKMKEAASHLCGEHDFKSFQSAGSETKKTVKKMYGIRVRNERCFLDRNIVIISIEMEADGFLYKMARNIAGALIFTGQGGMSPNEIKIIRESMDRKKAPPPAKPWGLYLKKVFY